MLLVRGDHVAHWQFVLREPGGGREDVLRAHRDGGLWGLPPGGTHQAQAKAWRVKSKVRAEIRVVRSTGVTVQPQSRR